MEYANILSAVGAASPAGMPFEGLLTSDLPSRWERQKESGQQSLEGHFIFWEDT